MKKLKKMRHKLIIKSVYSTRAECACGHWEFIGVRERTKKDVEYEFKKHKQLRAEGRVKYV